MTNEDHSIRSAAIRRFAVAGLVTVLLLVALLGAVVLDRDDDVGVAAPTLTQSSAEASPTTTTLDTRAEVIERLRRILGVRDKAFHERNADILEDVYTVDCPCLEGDRNAIHELVTNNYRIVGGGTSIRVRRANRVSAQLWLIVADFRSAPLRIEAEDNRVIREEPGGVIFSSSHYPNQPVQGSGSLVGQQPIGIVPDEFTSFSTGVRALPCHRSRSFPDS
jgi:hypothetical protein